MVKGVCVKKKERRQAGKRGKRRRKWREGGKASTLIRCLLKSEYQRHASTFGRTRLPVGIKVTKWGIEF